MLVLPLKPAVRYDIFSVLATWLDSEDQQVSFVPTNPLQFVIPKPEFCSVACRDDLLRLQSLRYALSDAWSKPTSHSIAELKDAYEYHAVLLEFEKRGFPTLDDESNGVRLIWKGAFHPQESERHASLTWDRVATSYNIVAMLTAKVADCSVTDREACKKAVGYCQTAAGIIGILQDLVPCLDVGTVDLSGAMLTFWRGFLLAQAQSYVYRMVALNPQQQHSTLAVLSKSAHLLFNEALTAAQDPRLVSEVSEQKQWAVYCKAASMLGAAKAEYHQSVVHRLAHEHGKEIRRLQQALEKLEECSRFTKGVDSCVDYLRRECNAILPVVKDRLHEADQDNYKIYQDPIPKTVEELSSKQMVKAADGLPKEMLVPQKELFMGV